MGNLVDEGVRQFVETGESEAYIQYLQNLAATHSDNLIQVLDLAAENKTFLDGILAPPILTGVGKTSANIFVDGNNSCVSSLLFVFFPQWFLLLQLFLLLIFFHLFIMFIEKLRDYFNFPNFS